MKRVDFASYAARLEERKAALSIEAPANDGSRRTPEKRALLKELEEAQRARGKKPVFTAAY
ncbi:MAG: hypothetical protein WCZ23_14785 [Rhodospirillaceae bacterium]